MLNSAELYAAMWDAWTADCEKYGRQMGLFGAVSGAAPRNAPAVLANKKKFKPPTVKVDAAQQELFPEIEGTRMAKVKPFEEALHPRRHGAASTRDTAIATDAINLGTSMAGYKPGTFVRKRSVHPSGTRQMTLEEQSAAPQVANRHQASGDALKASIVRESPSDVAADYKSRLADRNARTKQAIDTITQHFGVNVSEDDAAQILAHAGLDDWDAPILAQDLAMKHKGAIPVRQLVLGTHHHAWLNDKKGRLQEALNAAGDSKVIKFGKEGSHLTYVVHPSVQQGYIGKWQITTFGKDKEGNESPFGHQVHDSREDAIAAAIGAHPKGHMYDEGDSDYRVVDKRAAIEDADGYVQRYCAMSEAWGCEVERYSQEAAPAKRPWLDIAEEIHQTAKANPLVHEDAPIKRGGKEFGSHWMDSDDFELMEVPVDKIDWNPGHMREYGDHPAPKSVGPIVIDANRRKVGYTDETGLPNMIVLDGQHRLYHARQRGDKTIKAWVGDKARKQFEAAPERYSQRRRPMTKLEIPQSADGTARWYEQAGKLPQVSAPPSPMQNMHAHPHAMAGSGKGGQFAEKPTVEKCALRNLPKQKPSSQGQSSLFDIPITKGELPPSVTPQKQMVTIPKPEQPPTEPAHAIQAAPPKAITPSPSKEPIWTAQPEKALDIHETIAQHRAGDKTAFPKILKQCAGLVRNMAGRFYRPGRDPSELQQLASIGLFHAANSHDPAKGQFQQYAAQVMANVLAKEMGTKKTPARKGQRVLPQSPTSKEGEELIGQIPGGVGGEEEAVKNEKRDIVHSILADMGKTSGHSLIPEDEGEIRNPVTPEEQRQRAAKILMLKFGIQDDQHNPNGEELDSKTIAARFGMTRQRVEQLVAKAAAMFEDKMQERGYGKEQFAQDTPAGAVTQIDREGFKKRHQDIFGDVLNTDLTAEPQPRSHGFRVHSVHVGHDDFLKNALTDWGQKQGYVVTHAADTGTRGGYWVHMHQPLKKMVNVPAKPPVRAAVQFKPVPGKQQGWGAATHLGTYMAMYDAWTGVEHYTLSRYAEGEAEAPPAQRADSAGNVHKPGPGASVPRAEQPKAARLGPYRESQEKLPKTYLSPNAQAANVHTFTHPEMAAEHHENMRKHHVNQLFDPETGFIAAKAKWTPAQHAHAEAAEHHYNQLQEKLRKPTPKPTAAPTATPQAAAQPIRVTPEEVAAEPKSDKDIPVDAEIIDDPRAAQPPSQPTIRIPSEKNPHVVKTAGGGEIHVSRSGNVWQWRKPGGAWTAMNDQEAAQFEGKLRRGELNPTEPPKPKAEPSPAPQPAAQPEASYHIPTQDSPHVFNQGQPNEAHIFKAGNEWKAKMANDSEWTTLSPEQGSRMDAFAKAGNFGKPTQQAAPSQPQSAQPKGRLFDKNPVQPSEQLAHAKQKLNVLKSDEALTAAASRRAKIVAKQMFADNPEFAEEPKVQAQLVEGIKGQLKEGLQQAIRQHLDAAEEHHKSIGTDKGSPVWKEIDNHRYAVEHGGMMPIAEETNPTEAITAKWEGSGRQDLFPTRRDVMQVGGQRKPVYYEYAETDDGTWHYRPISKSNLPWKEMTPDEASKMEANRGRLEPASMARSGKNPSVNAPPQPAPVQPPQVSETQAAPEPSNPVVEQAAQETPEEESPTPTEFTADEKAALNDEIANLVKLKQDEVNEYNDAWRHLRPSSPGRAMSAAQFVNAARRAQQLEDIPGWDEVYDAVRNNPEIYNPIFRKTGRSGTESNFKDELFRAIKSGGLMQDVSPDDPEIVQEAMRNLGLGRHSGRRQIDEPQPTPDEEEIPFSAAHDRQWNNDLYSAMWGAWQGV